MTTVAKFIYSLKSKLGYVAVEPPHQLLWPNRNAVKRPIVELWQGWGENGIKDCAICWNGTNLYM